MDDRPCLRCDIATERGYIPDHSHGIVPAGWVRGIPQPNWIGGIKHKPMTSIVAYRCPKCGGLELVAPETPEEPKG